MSRVGKQPIKIISGAKVSVDAQGVVRIEGPKGKLSHQAPKGTKVRVEKDAVYVERDPNALNAGALQGTTRTVLHNLMAGVTTGFSKELEIVGVGYRAAVKGDTLSLTIGYSHPIDYKLPKGIEAKVDKNTMVTLSGADKVLLGMVAAEVRGFKPPEPYQGKGIKYVNERIIRKQGKAAGAK